MTQSEHRKLKRQVDRLPLSEKIAILRGGRRTKKVYTEEKLNEKLAEMKRQFEEQFGVMIAGGFNDE